MLQSGDLSLKRPRSTTVDHGLWWSSNWKDWTEAVLEISRPDRTTAVRPVMTTVRTGPWRALHHTVMDATCSARIEIIPSKRRSVSTQTLRNTVQQIMELDHSTKPKDIVKAISHEYK
jgi:hypothetical protein